MQYTSLCRHNIHFSLKTTPLPVEEYHHFQSGIESKVSFIFATIWKQNETLSLYHSLQAMIILVKLIRSSDVIIYRKSLDG